MLNMTEINRNAPAKRKTRAIGRIARSWRDPRRRPQPGWLIGAPARMADRHPNPRRDRGKMAVVEVTASSRAWLAASRWLIGHRGPLELLATVAPVFGLTPLVDPAGDRADVSAQDLAGRRLRPTCPCRIESAASAF